MAKTEKLKIDNDNSVKYKALRETELTIAQKALAKDKTSHSLKNGVSLKEMQVEEATKNLDLKEKKYIL